MKDAQRVRARRNRTIRRVRTFADEIEKPNTDLPAPRIDADSAQRSTLKAPAHYYELYVSAPIAFYTLDRQGRICELNEKAAKLLGFSTGWLLGRPFVVFIARQDIQRFLNFLRNSIGTLGETPVIELDMFVGSRTQPVQISLKTSPVNGAVTYRLTVVDLTDVRRTENLLQESLANWHSLVHNAPDTIMTVEARGRIAFVNKPVWGYSISALIGTNLLDHMPEIERPNVVRCLEGAFKFNRRSTCEITGVNKEWDRWFSFSFGSPHTSGLSGLTTTLMVREISDYKRAEDALRTSGEQLRDFAARVDAVREEERTRVAREIHDELGQALTALKLDLAWVQGKMRAATETRNKMKQMIVHVDNTIERVRRISSDLRPSILDELGLIPAIEWQASEFRKRTQIRTDVVSNTDGLDLPLEASAAVFRVVQEAFTNVMRHAKASRVRIIVNYENYALRISIIDNGRGMTRKQETGLKSLGIVGMKERVSRLGGDFNIFSEPRKGTRLEIIIPIHHD